MRFAGIDIAAETHFVAVVDEGSNVVVKPTNFSEDATGYEKLFALLDDQRHPLRVHAIISVSKQQHTLQSAGKIAPIG